MHTPVALLVAVQTVGTDVHPAVHRPLVDRAAATGPGEVACDTDRDAVDGDRERRRLHASGLRAHAPCPGNSASASRSTSPRTWMPASILSPGTVTNDSRKVLTCGKVA